MSSWVLQYASLLALAAAVASGLQCTNNSVYLEGRVTECRRNERNLCKYGVCWGEHLGGHSGLTVELTEELSFDCSAPGLTIWILPTRKDYDECTAGEGSQQLRVCQREGDEFVMYLVSDYTERTAQGNFVAVQADQTEVYMASLSADGMGPGACATGAKMVIGVNQTLTGGEDTDDPVVPSPTPSPTGIEDHPSVGELATSGSGRVLGCSLLAVLVAALLSTLSLWC